MHRRHRRLEADYPGGFGDVRRAGGYDARVGRDQAGITAAMVAVRDGYDIGIFVHRSGDFGYIPACW